MTLPDVPGKEGTYTKTDLDRDLIGPLTTLGHTRPVPVDEPDEWTVEGLEPPAWWHGDEEASMTALTVRTA
jgi:hypothetical protein